MSAQQKLLRDAVVAALVYRDVAGGNCCDGLRTNLTPDDLPFVAVYTPRRDADNKSGNAEIFRVTCQLVIDAYVALNQEAAVTCADTDALLAAALDQIEDDIKDAVFGAASVAALTMTFTGHSAVQTLNPPDLRLAVPCGTVRITATAAWEETYEPFYTPDPADLTRVGLTVRYETNDIAADVLLPEEEP